MMHLQCFNGIFQKCDALYEVVTGGGVQSVEPFCIRYRIVTQTKACVYAIKIEQSRTFAYVVSLHFHFE